MEEPRGSRASYNNNLNPGTGNGTQQKMEILLANGQTIQMEKNVEYIITPIGFRVDIREKEYNVHSESILSEGRIKLPTNIRDDIDTELYEKFSQCYVDVQGKKRIIAIFEY